MVGLGLDMLGPFVALRAQFLGFPLPLGFHPVVDRLAGLERQVGAAEAHLVDRNAERGGLRGDLGLDGVEDLSALLGQEGVQRRLAERAARGGADDAG